jgi:hypothetical protein
MGNCRYAQIVTTFSQGVVVMDVSSIPAVASDLSAQQTSNDVSMAVMRKSLDSQSTAAAGMLQALPPPMPAPTPSSNPNIGSFVNTVA